LNFGHCIGHAIESVTNYAIPHGQTVTLGMIWANIVSEKKKLLTTEIIGNDLLLLFEKQSHYIKETNYIRF
jgi:3-dehydroquinate synthase